MIWQGPSRRSVLKGLALGAGATVLSPIAEQLVSQAHGQTTRPKRFVLIVQSNGMKWSNFTPAAYNNGDKAPGVNPKALIDTREFELPKMYSNLAPLRDRLLLLDGLPNRNGAGHTGSYVGFSCLPNLGGSEFGAPGGITFDQYVANAVGTKTPYKSIVLGTSKSKEQVTYVGTSALGKYMPVPIMCQPSVSYAKLFGLVKGGGVADAELARQHARRTNVLDYLQEDVKRLQARLAGGEKQKLDQFVGSIEALETRLKIVQGFSLPSSCTSKSPGVADAASLEGRTEQNFELAKVALSCGLTNVLTLCAGSASNWDWPAILGLPTGFHGFGHGGHGGAHGYDAVHNWVAGLIVGLAKHLDSFKEGDGTMLDNTIIMWTNDNGEQHHAKYFRWPAVLIGGGGVLKADGRYVRYPVRDMNDETEHSFAELYNTLSRVYGAPTDTFGKGGREPVNGPLSALMV